MHTPVARLHEVGWRNTCSTGYTYAVISGCNTNRPARVTTDPEYTEARHKGKQGPERPQGWVSFMFFFLQYFSLYFLFTPCHMKEIDKNVSVLINMIKNVSVSRLSGFFLHLDTHINYKPQVVVCNGCFF